MHKKNCSIFFSIYCIVLFVDGQCEIDSCCLPHSLFPTLLSLFIVCCSVCLLLCHLQAILKASQMQNDFCIAVVALSVPLSLSRTFCPSLWAFITDSSPLSPIASFEHASWIKPIVKSYFYVHISFLANIYACLSHSLPPPFIVMPFPTFVSLLWLLPPPLSFGYHTLFHALPLPLS